MVRLIADRTVVLAAVRKSSGHASVSFTSRHGMTLRAEPCKFNDWIATVHGSRSSSLPKNS